MSAGACVLSNFKYGKLRRVQSKLTWISRLHGFLLQVVSQYSNILSPLCVDAVMKVIDPVTASNVDLKDIKIIKKLGYKKMRKLYYSWMFKRFLIELSMEAFALNVLQVNEWKLSDTKWLQWYSGRYRADWRPSVQSEDCRLRRTEQSREGQDRPHSVLCVATENWHGEPSNVAAVSH